MDAADSGPQPAPLSAFTVNVYDVPFVKPDTTHDKPAVRHVFPPGEDVTKYVDTGNDPDNAGADHDTTAEALAPTAPTEVGGPAGTGAGGLGSG